MLSGAGIFHLLPACESIERHIVGESSPNRVMALLELVAYMRAWILAMPEAGQDRG